MIYILHVIFTAFTSLRTNVKVVLMKTAMGSLEAQNAVISVAKMLNPKLVLYVGICGTMKPNKACRPLIIVIIIMIYLQIYIIIKYDCIFWTKITFK